MSELLESQRGFAAALRDAEASSRAGSWLAGDAALVAQRLAIYRANAAASAAKALTAAYPVLLQVVGKEFFGGLARSYLRARPSTCGNLYDYGGEFADFLAKFPHAQSLPYLPDLARLEWLVHRAYGAADAKPWDPSGLMAVSPQLQGEIRFEFAAGTAVMNSAYPIAHIWAIHQPEHEGEFVVDWSIAERALVARAGLRVTVTALGVGNAAFFIAALEGGTLDDVARSLAEEKAKPPQEEAARALPETPAKVLPEEAEKPSLEEEAKPVSEKNAIPLPEEAAGPFPEVAAKPKSEVADEPLPDRETLTKE